MGENEKTIQALIRLIDDPDDTVYSQIKGKLLDYGDEAIPYLEQAWLEGESEELFQDRINWLIRDIQLGKCLDKLKEWKDKSQPDLLEGAIILAQFQFPDLKAEEVFDKVEEIRKDIWLEINEQMTSFEKIKVFNKVFFNIYGFHGNKDNFHDPLNSFINEILLRKKGNPLGLSLLYAYVAQELDIPVYGVNLPNHFVLAYIDRHNVLDFVGDKNSDGVLFYINAFNKGAIFNKTDIDSFLKQMNLELKKEYYLPCSNVAFIRRMVVNLVYAYSKQNNTVKAYAFEKMKQLFDGEKSD